MLSRTHTWTFGTCGARTLLGEAYRATPLGGGLGSHPLTLDLPRCTAADHQLPRVPLNNGLSDDLHAVCTVTTFSPSQGLLVCDNKCVLLIERGDVSWLAVGNYPLDRPAVNTREEYAEMLSRTYTGTFGTRGARTLLGEAYRAIPFGCGLGSHPLTLDLPRCTAADHQLPKVPLNNGLCDDLHAVRTVTTCSLS